MYLRGFVFIFIVVYLIKKNIIFINILKNKKITRSSKKESFGKRKSVIYFFFRGGGVVVVWGEREMGGIKLCERNNKS